MQLQTGHETPIGLLRRADEALVWAKAQGRKRVVPQTNVTGKRPLPRVDPTCAAAAAPAMTWLMPCGPATGGMTVPFLLPTEPLWLLAAGSPLAIHSDRTAHPDRQPTCLCAGMGQPWPGTGGWRGRGSGGAGADRSPVPLVTVGSYPMFPRSFIYFGVLHGHGGDAAHQRLTAGWDAGCGQWACWPWPCPGWFGWALRLLAGLAETFNGPCAELARLRRTKPSPRTMYPLFPGWARDVVGHGGRAMVAARRPHWLARAAGHRRGWRCWAATA